MSAAMLCDAELTKARNAQEPHAVVDALCAAWIQVRSLRIATLARGFSRRLKAKAVEGATVTAREAEWHEVAQSHGLGQLESLLLSPWPGRVKDARKRFEVLKGFGPDPRTVAALIALDTGERYLSGEGDVFWQDVWRQLLVWSPGETIASFIRHTTAPAVSPVGEERKRAVFSPLLERWTLGQAYEPELPPSTVRLLETLEARLLPSRARVAGLLDAVFAAPDDDRPKLVLADALTEEGDPRGEFISSQFAHASGQLPLGLREKMQRLLESSGAEWLAPFKYQVAPVAVFERGFATEVRLAARVLDVSAPEWKLVRVLELAGLAMNVSATVDVPQLRGLHSLRRLDGSSFTNLVRLGQPRAWKCLEVTSGGDAGLPIPRWTVERLRVLGPIDQSVWWILRSELHQRVGVLELAVTQGFERVGAAVTQSKPIASELCFRGTPAPWPDDSRGDWELTFGSHADAARTRARVTVHADQALPALVSSLKSLAPESVTHALIRTSLKKGPGWRKRVAAELAAVLPRRCEVLVELDAPLGSAPAPVVLRPR